MVVGESGANNGHRVDRAFSALADATRRDILRRAAIGEHSVSGLAEHYAMSFAAVQKHVAILERAGLVTKRRRGREQLVRTDVRTVREVREALEGLEALWRERLDRFAETLADQQLHQHPHQHPDRQIDRQTDRQTHRDEESP